MFTAKIITPSGDEFVREVERLSVPTTDGVRTILAHHIDAIMTIREGEVLFMEGNDKETIHVTDGIFQFSDNVAYILVNHIEEPVAEVENN